MAWGPREFSDNIRKVGHRQEGMERGGINEAYGTCLEEQRGTPRKQEVEFCEIKWKRCLT